MFEGKITKHFTWDEATRSTKAKELGLDNSPEELDIPNILHTARNMEVVRKILQGNAIAVSSWYRNGEVNRAVGGVANSAHRRGFAVDFSCSGFGSPLEVCRELVASGVQFDQLIWEYGRWVHISFAPAMRQNVLHIKKGTGYQLGLPS